MDFNDKNSLAVKLKIICLLVACSWKALGSAGKMTSLLSLETLNQKIKEINVLQRCYNK